MDIDVALIHRFGIAILLGLLIGFQREWASKSIAGVRTFALITTLGVLSVVIAEATGGWVVAAALLAVAAFFVVGNLLLLRQGESDPGMTSETAAIVMFGVGCLLGLGHIDIAVPLTGGIAVLLHWKQPIHDFVHKVGEKDLNAMVRLILVALVILPVLPDRELGPYAALNPFNIWLMVVLIVGISMGAYVAYKMLGAQTGSLLTGVFGGLISSTATTIGYARRANRQPELAPMGIIVIIIASTIVFGRVMVEIALVAPEFLRIAGPPIGMVAGTMAVAGAIAFLFAHRRVVEPTEIEPPADLVAAMTFGVLYAIVLIGVAAGREYFSDAGMYVVAALSGLTDMDAITLSTAHLVDEEQIETDVAWRLIMVGSMANLVFKGIVVAMLGTRRIFLPVAAAFAAAMCTGTALLIFWT